MRALLFTTLVCAAAAAGGMLGGAREATADAQCFDAVRALQTEITAELTAAGVTPAEYTPVACRRQVVAGTVYYAKVAVGGGEHAHVKVFRPLPQRRGGEAGGEVQLVEQAPQLMGVRVGHKAGDPILSSDDYELSGEGAL